MLLDLVPHHSVLDVGNLVKRDSPLLRRVRGWWRTLPHLSGGTRVVNLVAPQHGTLFGMPTSPTATSGRVRQTRRPGGVGELRFDGLDDGVDIAGLFGGTMVEDAGFCTVACWLWLTAFTAFGAVFDGTATGTDSGRECSLLINSATDGYAAMANNFGAALTFNPVWTLGEWQHCVLTRYGTVLTTYRNGVPNGATVDAQAVGGGFGAAVSWYLGFNVSGGGSHLQGRLDDVLLLGRSVSAGEAMALYQASRAGWPSGLHCLPLSPGMAQALGVFPGGDEGALWYYTRMEA